MPDPRGNPSLQDLVGAAIRDAADLARQEFALFRAEMSSNVTGLAKGAGMFVAAAVFAVASIIWTTQALVYGLTLIVGSAWLAALIVGIGLAIIAAAFVLAGKSMLSASSLAPTRTVRSLKRDGDLVSERTP